MSRIVTLTLNPAVDKSSVTARVKPNRKLRCEVPRREPGGGGLNVSRALRRLGCESLAVFPAGGPSGRVLNDLLEDEGVETEPLDIQGWTRENLAVREGEENHEDHQFRFVFPGPEVSVEEAEGCLEVLRGLEPAPDYVVASGSLPRGLPEDFYARVAEVAGELDARFVLDTSGPALEKGLSGDVFLLKPNLRELASLTSLDEGEAENDGGYEEAQARAARELLNEGRARVVLVSMGSAGALLVSRDEVTRIPTPTVPIKSRAGAGDSAVAGMVAGLDRGYELSPAARLAVAAGAAAVMTPGSELCRKTDVEALFSRMEE